MSNGVEEQVMYISFARETWGLSFDLYGRYTKRRGELPGIRNRRRFA